MFKIPAKAWPRIGAAINAARNQHNEGVPSKFWERPQRFAVERDVQSKRLHVTAVEFATGVQRARVGRNETWVEVA